MLATSNYIQYISVILGGETIPLIMIRRRKTVFAKLLALALKARGAHVPTPRGGSTGHLGTVARHKAYVKSRGVPEMVPLVCVKMGISQNCIPFESNTWWYSNHRQNIYTGQTDVGRPSLSGGKSLAKVLIVKVSSYKHGFVSHYCCYELS